MNRRYLPAFAALLFGLSLTTGLAQKSADTLRVGVYQPISIIDGIYDPTPQTNLMDRVIFDTLIAFDTEKRELVPSLAKSWRYVDSTTIEFTLREDVRFHDGSEFDADDVVYTVNFVMDPTSKFRFKDTRFGQFAGIEKVDKYTVRIKTRETFATFLTRITASLPIYPSDYHSALADKTQFGRRPIGTGPYKAVQVDSNKGVILVKNTDFRHESAGQRAAKIGRIHILPIPDQQTQLAKLLINELDLIYDVPADIADLLRANPALEISVRPTVSFAFLMLDAANRSGFNKFKDIRIREAVFRAIDRKTLVAALQPAEVANLPLQQAMCHPWHIACTSSLSPPAFDLATAKQLLAQAGFPDGFNLTITTWGPSRFVAEAAAGQLRKVGINTQIETLTVPGYTQKRAAGQLPAYVVLWDNGGGLPDVESTAGFFYEPGDRNYNQDQELSALQRSGQSVVELEKREEIYRQIFDKATQERYSLPLIPLAAVMAHSKDVKIPEAGTKKPEGFMFNLLEWK